MTLGFGEVGMGSNTKSAWQVEKWEGACRACRKAGNTVEGLFGFKPGQLSNSGMFKNGLGEDVC